MEWKELNARGKTTRKRDERERERERDVAKKKAWSADRRRTTTTTEVVVVKFSGARRIEAVGETRTTPTTRGTTATGKPWRFSEGTCGRPARYSHSSSRGCLKPRRRGARVRRTKQSAKAEETMSFGETKEERAVLNEEKKSRYSLV